MRVAVVALRFPSLSETFVLNHVSGLLDAGHEVDVYSTFRPTEALAHPDVTRYSLAERTTYLDVPRVRHRVTALPRGLRAAPWASTLRWLRPARYGPGTLSLKPLFSLPALEAARRSGTRPRYDAVHCHYGTQGYAYLFLRDYFGAPVVTSFHGFDLVCFGRLGPLAYRTLFRRGDAFVANSHSTRRRLERLGCPGAKIAVIPSIVDDRGVAPRGEVLGGDRVRVLTVARLDEAKGVQHMIRAVRLLRDRGYPVEYTVVGDGPYRGTLEALTESLGLQEAVRFDGWQTRDAVYARYREADVFVLPSVRSRQGGEEAQGLVLHEAQLHGVPAVGTRIGGIPESVGGGEAGVLCDPGDPGALARAVQDLCDDPAAARRLAAAAREFCQRSRSKRALTAEIERLYKSLGTAA